MYQGTFTGKELDFLVEYACNALMQAGAFPFISESKMRESASPWPDEDQMEQ